MSARLAGLSRLLEARKEAALLALREAEARAAAIEAGLAALVDPAAGAIDPEAPITAAQVAARWQAWRDARRRVLNVELAQARVAAAAARDAARQAFGREQVGAALARQAEEARRKARQRRGEG
jgi:hypothetical protein